MRKKRQKHENKRKNHTKNKAMDKYEKIKKNQEANES